MNNRPYSRWEAASMLKKVISIVSLMIVGSLWPISARAVSTPDWLHNLAQQPQKHYANDVDAVTLLDDETTIVKDNGEIIHRTREAYRILRPEGRGVAVLHVHFDNERKMNSLHGWSITAKGQEYEAKDKDAFERSASTYEIFSDVKERILDVPGAEIDDAQEDIGNEDEENNYYSLGGDKD